MLGRLVIKNEEQRERTQSMGIADVNQIFSMEEMAKGDVLFAATGVTDGNMLKGVKVSRSNIVTDTVVMRSSTGTVRYIKGVHSDVSKFMM